MYVYIAFFVIAAVYVGVLFYSSVVYEDRIYPGIAVAGVEVGGVTKEEAQNIIAKRVEELRKNPVDRKSTRLNSSHIPLSRMPSSA